MLLQIDDLSRPDHAHLTREDICYYIREYTSNEGFAASPNNQLVFNLKCPVNHGTPGRLHYKQQAIRSAARDVAEAFSGLKTDETVFIPLPPSKLPSSTAHDPRVRDMLRSAEASCGIRVVEALTIREDRAAAHETPDRPTIGEIQQNFVLQSRDWLYAKNVAIFDDVLTNGTQFKAAVNFLRPHHPQANFVGVFWVRRIFPA